LFDKTAYDLYPFVNKEDQSKFQSIFGEYGPDVLARIIPYGKQILGESPVITSVEYIGEGFGNVRLESGYGRIAVTSSVEDYKNLNELPVRFRKTGIVSNSSILFSFLFYQIIINSLTFQFL
jgi:hypothetical protein